MSWHRRFWNVLRAGRHQRDLEREFSFHIRERAEELQAGGLEPDTATQLARRQFGNLTTEWERTREMDMHLWLETVARNLRYALRALTKTPAFTLTVIAILALGIGANTAVFSAIDAVLLRPLPFPNGDQLLLLIQSSPSVPDAFVAPTRVEDWNRLNDAFTAISGYYVEDISETSGELPEKLKRATVTPRFLEVLGVAPAVGRDFSQQEEQFGGPNAVLISDRLWRRRFGGDPRAIGKGLRIAGSIFPIVGVMPASFRFPDRDVDLWSPMPPNAPWAQSREETWYNVIGRLKAGVGVEHARSNLAAVQHALSEQYPKSDGDISVLIKPLKEATVGGARKSLWLLFGSVSLLLLIACTNTAALLLSRTVARRHEISVRFSLGASRSAVAAQVFSEVLILAVAGAILGLLVAAGAAQVFRVLAKDLPRIDEIRMNAGIVTYSLLCAVGATLLCAMVPAIRGTHHSVANGLAQGGRAHVSGGHPLQFLLVGVQVALSVMLLAGAGLLLRSFQELGRVFPGFDPQHVLTFHISSIWAEANDRRATKQRTDRILEGLRTIPGVEAASIASSLPGVPTQYQVEFKTTEGRAESEPKMLAQSRAVTPEYFATMRIPLLRGQLCREEPNTFTMVVNRSFADRYLNGALAVGRHVLQPNNPYAVPAEIRGIVGDARETGLDREAVPTAYWCTATLQPYMSFLVRTQGEPMAIAQTVRRKIHELEPRRSVYDLTPLTDHISDAYAENRLRTVLLVFFALTAITLASVGLYGTLSYLVHVRQREVAVRLALGASRIGIVRQIVGEGLRVSLLGCLAGMTLAVASRRLLAGMLYGVSTTDMAAWGAVLGLALAVSIAASSIPAVRAARLEPLRALRQE